MATSPGGCSLHNAVVVVVCYTIDKCTGQPLRPIYIRGLLGARNCKDSVVESGVCGSV